ncbi:hypothetical protein J6G99_00195 [bacterium]|nr:hypothetical protein [bacterium]
MVCKMLFFDYSDNEKSFFKKNKADNYDIKFFNFSLNEKTLNKLNIEDIELANSINISNNSKINNNILKNFKNLRVIATRSKNVDHIDLKSCINRNIAVVNVEDYKENAPLYNLNISIKGITNTLCGCKEYRIV